MLPLIMTKFGSVVDSPVGPVTIMATDEFVTHILFGNHAGDLESNDLIQRTSKEISAYFKGSIKNFTIPLEPEGTDFQKKVWKALLEIPYGKTISYKELSLKLGDLKAIRAVGTANGANPIAIVIPCHRVIGSNG